MAATPRESWSHAGKGRSKESVSFSSYIQYVTPNKSNYPDLVHDDIHNPDGNYKKETQYGSFTRVS